ncbi:glycoside hydrolase family 43 protein [Anditalea andensis]|uniref:Glycoside hydrolase n=1 Tax=Anditalea andensis TaxID=1048983 RepID=A0A074L1N7_9BACT|nr:glycoside hydrolase 43 family protein [Anditalea andensis]KEO73778.1 glycoside hydrolase [Anditalea andensis]
MYHFYTIALIAFVINGAATLSSYGQKAINPIIHADVPDISMIRVDDTYYMSSTTMHMNPGVPIMKSKDLVNWEIVSYASTSLGSTDDLKLENGKDMYGKGSWASSLRYHEGIFYVSTFSGNTGKTYIYSTENIEEGPWKTIEFKPSMHDHTLFFEEGKAYLIWGAGTIKIVELKSDLSGIIPDSEQVLIENANDPIQEEIMLPAEGSQMFKVKDKYYLFNIAWPRGGMRTVIIHRADSLKGPYKGKIALQDKGVAQGGLIDTPEGDWYAFLFRDNGAVGRIPYLVPITWKAGWPEIGVEGVVPMELDNLPINKGLVPGIVASDNFKRKKGERALPLVWQWNHNPVDKLWSINGKKGYLSMKTDRIDKDLLAARNTLTQRTIGPESMGTIKIDVSDMKEGDLAGLTLLQKDYGFIGVQVQKGQKKLVMKKATEEKEKEIASIEFSGESVLLRAVCDFKDAKDEATFFYSTNGKQWKQLGDVLQMKYTLPHFMGYRFGLFYFATEEPGGQVKFDHYEIDDQITY